MGTLAFGRTDGGQGTVAGVGTAQSGAASLAYGMNVVTTAVGETGARLPEDAPLGSPVIVHVTSATAALVFPPVGGSINGGAANASFSVAQNKPTVFYPKTNGLDWVAVLSA